MIIKTNFVEDKRKLIKGDIVRVSMTDNFGTEIELDIHIKKKCKLLGFQMYRIVNEQFEIVSTLLVQPAYKNKEIPTHIKDAINYKDLPAEAFKSFILSL